MKYHSLCQWADVPDPGTRGVETVINGEVLELIVVKWQSQPRVYVNSCPHTGVALNWLPDQFLTPDGRLLQCGMHGALFQPQDGLCVHGPCLGARLQSIDCAIVDGAVCLLLDDRPSSGQVDHTTAGGQEGKE